MSTHKHYRPKSCSHCDDQFLPAHNRQMFCSDVCLIADNSQPSVTHSHEGSSCWHWTGGLSRDGYGKLTLRGYERFAHRISYEAHKGPIPANAPVVRHLCNNPSCVNPAHLAAGTHADNMRDKIVAGSVRGTNNPRARLTEDQVRAIKHSSESANTIVDHYGVSYHTVRDIRAGRSWRHL